MEDSPGFFQEIRGRRLGKGGGRGRELFCEDLRGRGGQKHLHMTVSQKRLLAEGKGRQGVQVFL